MAETITVPQNSVVGWGGGDIDKPGCIVAARCTVVLTAGDTAAIYCAHNTIATRTFPVSFSADQVFVSPLTEATVTYSVPAATTAVNLSPSAALSTTTYTNDTVTITGAGLDGTENAGTVSVLILGHTISTSTGS